MRAQCGSMTVPLNSRSTAEESHSTNEAGHIELSIVRIPAQKISKRTDGFTFIAGGPGQSAIETYPSVAFAFRHIQRDHDIVLIDQRGTGKSVKLECEESTDTMGLDTKSNPKALADAAKTCLKSLPHDPKWFTTSLAVHDLERVNTRCGGST